MAGGNEAQRSDRIKLLKNEEFCNISVEFTKMVIIQLFVGVSFTDRTTVTP
ncbi:MAG: hypothetical protein LBC02_06100 [Planctomycetaceae bacterium]|jgi:hypothetical protein|nr:hypothetical protein [Planctomycetaceae bacterium]